MALERAIWPDDAPQPQPQPAPKPAIDDGLWKLPEKGIINTNTGTRKH